MICNSCGGEYADDLLICPYCHSENEKAVEETKEDILEGYDDAAKHLIAEAEKYPKEKANRLAGKIVLIVVAVVVIGAMITLVAVFGNRNKGRKGLNAKNKHIDKMEAFLLDEDYEGLKSYMEQYRLGYGYDKYDEVRDTYVAYSGILRNDENIKWHKGEPDNDRETWEGFVLFHVKRIIILSGNVMGYYEKYADDDNFWGNEDILGDMYFATLEILSGYGLTEEEIAEISLDKESTKYNTLVNKISDYYWGLTK